MSDEKLDTEKINEVTKSVDIDAPPTEEEPTALLLFGTNQRYPVDIATERYQRGLAPLIIATGGVNRHNGIVEGRESFKMLTERGIPETAIRCEDQSANTWQNVEFSVHFLREALAAGLRITAVSKWYHRRAIHILKTLMPDIGPFHALSWSPVYAGRLVTRDDWPLIPDGKRRVIREWEEVGRRVANGSLAPVESSDGSWH